LPSAQPRDVSAKKPRISADKPVQAPRTMINRSVPVFLSSRREPAVSGSLIV